MVVVFGRSSRWSSTTTGLCLTLCTYAALARSKEPKVPTLTRVPSPPSRFLQRICKTRGLLSSSARTFTGVPHSVGLTDLLILYCNYKSALSRPNTSDSSLDKIASRSTNNVRYRTAESFLPTQTPSLPTQAVILKCNTRRTEKATSGCEHMRAGGLYTCTFLGARWLSPLRNRKRIRACLMPL